LKSLNTKGKRERMLYEKIYLFMECELLTIEKEKNRRIYKDVREEKCEKGKDDIVVIDNVLKSIENNSKKEPIKKKESNIIDLSDPDTLSNIQDAFQSPEESK